MLKLPPLCGTTWGHASRLEDGAYLATYLEPRPPWLFWIVDVLEDKVLVRRHPELVSVFRREQRKIELEEGVAPPAPALALIDALLAWREEGVAAFVRMLRTP